MPPACNAFTDNLYALECLLRRAQGVTDGAVVQRIVSRVGPPEWYALMLVMLCLLALLSVLVIVKEGR